MVTSEQLQQLRLKITSGNEVPVRDARLSAEQVQELVSSIEHLVTVIDQFDPAMVPEQLKDSVDNG